MGIFLAIFQQLTGINVVMFYSSTIFNNLQGFTANGITALIGGVNFASTFLGMILLGYLGRKTLMFFGSAMMSACLIALGFALLSNSTGLCIFLVLGFITISECSSGPITWLYMAEIMQDKALSISTVMNWIINFMIALLTPIIVDAVGEDKVGYIFIVMGGFTVVGTVYIMIFMKETRGKTSQEIQIMFNQSNKFTE